MHLLRSDTTLPYLMEWNPYQGTILHALVPDMEGIDFTSSHLSTWLPGHVLQDIHCPNIEWLPSIRDAFKRTGFVA